MVLTEGWIGECRFEMLSSEKSRALNFTRCPIVVDFDDELSEFRDVGDEVDWV